LVPRPKKFIGRRRLKSTKNWTDIRSHLVRVSTILKNVSEGSGPPGIRATDKCRGYSGVHVLYVDRRATFHHQPYGVEVALVVGEEEISDGEKLAVFEVKLKR
jgi:hypothetical protein